MSIETKVEQLLVDAGVATVPVPVEQVAEHLGIKIELADLGEDCSGVLVRNGSRAVIGINRAHHFNRRRFSIAHEIAHFFFTMAIPISTRDIACISETLSLVPALRKKKWRPMLSPLPFSCPPNGSRTLSISNPLI